MRRMIVVVMRMVVTMRRMSMIVMRMVVTMMRMVVTMTRMIVVVMRMVVTMMRMIMVVMRMVVVIILVDGDDGDGGGCQKVRAPSCKELCEEKKSVAQYFQFGTVKNTH